MVFRIDMNRDEASKLAALKTKDIIKLSHELESLRFENKELEECVQTLKDE